MLHELTSFSRFTLKLDMQYIATLNNNIIVKSVVMSISFSCMLTAIEHWLISIVYLSHNHVAILAPTVCIHICI